MVKALSKDLRDRLLNAVEGGMTCRAAATRFGVAPSTAIRWVSRLKETGHRTPKRQGGDLRSHRIEAHGDFILELVEERKDITLAEIAEKLESERAFTAAQSTIWRFFARRGITFKKRQRMLPSSSGQTS